MHQTIMNAIIDELRVKQCLRDIAQYWTFRSTVPGPGLRKVSEFLCRRHCEHGIEAEIIPYPADDKTEWLNGHKNPLEWAPKSGRLSVVKPLDKAGQICSYAEEPLSLICNSTSTPVGGIEAEVVVMHSGIKDEEYEGIDVKGKIIFTDLPAGSVEAQARKRDAIAVISDCICPPWLSSHPPIRQPEDVPDLTMWSIFSGRRNETGLWGFSLSARQGRRLRQIIRENDEPVILHAEVDADLIEGASEMVNALLPGTDLAEEEIWVLAHSSEPGARDNASGCCLSVEIARTLKTLIEKGTLPPLRRSIRFMNGVEVSGFLPYIDARRNELDRVIAGLCLDSVGQSFSICGGEFVLFQSPEQNPSFIDGLMEHLISAAAAEPIGRFSSDTYATFPWRTEPFWGNDAFVSDGFFDIPTPQISTWPDKFYHSSMDTPEQMSDNTLGRVGAIVGTYLYLLATAGRREAMWFAGLTAREWKRRICDILSSEALKGDILTQSDESGTRIQERAVRLRAMGRHLGLQGHDAVKQTLRFAPRDEALLQTVERMGDDMKLFGIRESNRMIELTSKLSNQKAPLAPKAPHREVDDPRKTMVLKRLRWRVPPDNAFSEEGQAILRTLRERINSNVARIWDWLNGWRTAEEVWERVQFGGVMPFNVVAAYLELLIAEGFAVKVEM
ncbi:MAG: DUF4910 domain-containing protein [Candidatus Poribacteria bacterium]